MKYRTSARWRGLILALTVASTVIAAVGAPAAEAGWSSRGTGVVNLKDIACPADDTCYAVSNRNAIVKTTDGGTTWVQQQPVGAGDEFEAIACPSTSTCYAVGTFDLIRATTDGGVTWTTQSSGSEFAFFKDISCPSTSTCYAAADGIGGVFLTTNGGASWSSVLSWGTISIGCASTTMCAAGENNWTLRWTHNGGSSWSGQTYGGPGNSFDVDGVACPSTTVCYAVGGPGGIRKTTNGSTPWNAQSSGTTSTLYGVTCTSTSTCYAVGAAGTIIATADGGSTWTKENSGSAETIRDISCPSASVCYAVAETTGTVLKRQTSGGDTEDILGAVQRLIPRGAPSDDCVAPSATVIDGYFGSLYARLRTQGSGTNTWVCARLQPEGGTEYAGGKLEVQEAGSAVSQDSQYDACSSQTDNLMPAPHPFTQGHLGDEDDPPFVPYLLDAYANNRGQAWVCLQASLGARVMLDGVGVFEQDDPTMAVSPPRTPWTPGKASTDCETQTSGTKTRLVNAVISGTQVWLTSWQTGSKVQLCVRAQGSSTAGGRLTLEAGASGVTPVLTSGSDTSACTTDVFVNTTQQLYVRRSPTGQNPASVCITKGTTSLRYTVGFTGSPSVVTPNWAIDS